MNGQAGLSNMSFRSCLKALVIHGPGGAGGTRRGGGRSARGRGRGGGAMRRGGAGRGRRCGGP